MVAVAVTVMAQEPPPRTEAVHLVLGLLDGSSLIVKPRVSAIPIRTAHAQLNLALKEISLLTFDRDRETVTVDLQDGENLRGAPGVDEIEVDAIFGKTSIKLAHIKTLEVVVSDASLPPLRRANDCLIRRERGYMRLTSPANDNTWAMTIKEYATPLRIRLRARTDSTNIRLRYGFGGVIFNWEAGPDQLVIADLLRPGERFEEFIHGKGRLSTAEWHDIVWEIDTGVTRVFADGKLLYTGAGDFSPLSAPVCVGPAWGSTVDVASLVIEPMKSADAAEPDRDSVRPRIDDSRQ
jgi:hypothetical protein